MGTRVRNKGRACGAIDCPDAARCRGYCNRHYKRLLAHGDPNYTPPPPTNKRCNRCKVVLPIENFYRKGNGYRYVCKGCYRVAVGSSRTAERHAEDMRAWRRANPGGQRDASLRYRFGITGAEFDALLATQEGRCRICRGDNNGRTLSVDHCHVSARVRGLLCVRCNTLLGFARDDIGVLKAAAAYLEIHT